VASTAVAVPTIVDAITDRRLFGGCDTFANLSSWRPWLVLLRALYGLPLRTDDGIVERDGEVVLGDSELALFQRHTGHEAPREGGYHELVVITGRQSGKTRTAALIGTFEAARAVLAGERGLYVPLVAQDLRGAQRALFGYVRELIEGSELLRGEVTRETATEIELAGQVTIGTYPCRPASVRGIRAACALIDELAFFVSTDGRPTDTEMLRAVRPALSTTGGKLVILSSPYGQSGALYELHRRHFGKDESDVLVWSASAPAMNPTLPADYLTRMQVEDPEAYRSEVLGEFRQGISTFLDPDALAAVVDAGVRERAPVAGVSYVAYADAASGSGKDSFAVGVAHRDGERAVLDCIRAWKPPFSPSGVIGEVADLLKRYRISAIEGDKYAPGFVAEGFKKVGITYSPSPRTTSDTYLELLPRVNAGAVRIVDDSVLLRELRGLERRRGASGRDRVDHRPGAHDDRAVAAAGALVAVGTLRDRSWRARVMRGL
jgi:hypothetical protein